MCPTPVPAPATPEPPPGHLVEWILERCRPDAEAGPARDLQPTPAAALVALVDRLVRRANDHVDVLVLAKRYLARYIEAAGADPRDARRLLVVAVTVASKFEDDFADENAGFARDGQLSLRQLNELERHFLRTIDFCLVVPDEEALVDWRHDPEMTLRLRRHHAARPGAA